MTSNHDPPGGQLAPAYNGEATNNFQPPGTPQPTMDVLPPTFPMQSPVQYTQPSPLLLPSLDSSLERVATEYYNNYMDPPTLQHLESASGSSPPPERDGNTVMVRVPRPYVWTYVMVVRIP